MSWLSKGLHKVGGLAEKVAPYVGLIPGVGTIAGGAIGGLGALAHGDGLSGALKYGALGAAGGAGGAALRSMSTGGKALAIGSAAVKHGVPNAGGPSMPSSVGGMAGAADMAGAGDGGGLMSSIAGFGHSALDFAKGHGSELLAGAQVLNAAKLGKKSNQYADNAMNSVNQSYMDRAGLRSSGIDEMMHPQAPDVTQLQRIRSSNPYAGTLPLARAA